MTEKLSAWLRSLLAAPEIAWDSLGPQGGVALFPRGQRELWRRTDILGGLRRRVRYSLVLRLNTCRQGQEMEQLLWDLARRAEESAPILGADQQLTVEDARQTHRDGQNRARYELNLIFEFTE